MGHNALYLPLYAVRVGELGGHRGEVVKSLVVMGFVVSDETGSLIIQEGCCCLEKWLTYPAQLQFRNR
jgi:hypothetical protein